MPRALAVMLQRPTRKSVLVVCNPARGEKPGERGARPVKPTGYRPGRKSQQRRKSNGGRQDRRP